MIDINKTYRTVAGDSVTILSTSARGHYPVIGYIGDSNELETWTENGAQYFDTTDSTDLVEYTPFQEFKLDDPVYYEYVKYNTSTEHRGHFAGVNEIGSPKIWEQGCTSWTTNQSFSVHSVRKP